MDGRMRQTLDRVVDVGMGAIFLWEQPDRTARPECMTGAIAPYADVVVLDFKDYQGELWYLVRATIPTEIKRRFRKPKMVYQKGWLLGTMLMELGRKQRLARDGA